MTRARSNIILVFWVFSLAVSERAAASGERSDIRGAGMARTFTATSRGLNAVGINPANLAFDDQSTFTVSILPAAIHLGSDFLDYGLYTAYFTGLDTDSGRVARYLNSDDKKRILDGFGSDNGLATADAEIRLLGVALRLGGVGAFAFTVTEHVGAYANIPRDYVDFLLNGNAPGSTLDFRGTDLKVSWVREYALSYGRSVPRLRFLKSLNVGVTGKLIHGYGYYDVQRFNTMLNTGVDGTLNGTVNFQSRLAGADPLRSGVGYQPFPQPAGTGFGIDIGVSGEISEALSFGMSVTDIGSMRWQGNVEETIVDTTLLIDDPFLVGQKDAIQRALKGHKVEGNPFVVPLPTQFRFGLALQVTRLPAFGWVPGTLLVGLDYNQGLHNLPGSITRPRFSLGVEYAPVRWLPLRSGVSIGGTDHANVAFGFGIDLGLFKLDVASENVTWLFAPKSFNYGSVAIGMKLCF